MVYGGHLALLAFAAWEEGRRAAPPSLGGQRWREAPAAARPPSAAGRAAIVMLHAVAAVVVCIGTRTGIVLAIAAAGALAAAAAAEKDGSLVHRPLLRLLALGAPVVLAGLGGWAAVYSGALPTFDDIRGLYV